MEAIPNWREGISNLVEHFAKGSHGLHREALKQGGRGAWLHYSSCVADMSLNKQPQLKWVSSEAVKEMKGSEVLNEYNPQTHIVLIIVVSISKKRAKQGEGDCFTHFAIIDRDHGKTPTRTLNAGTQCVFGKRICFTCKAFLEKIMTCKRCRYAAYCGRECQVKDWETHKRCCKTMRESKAEDLEMLDEFSKFQLSSSSGTV